MEQNLKLVVLTLEKCSSCQNFLKMEIVELPYNTHASDEAKPEENDTNGNGPAP